MTEITEETKTESKSKTTRNALLGGLIAVVLIVEVLLAVVTGNRQTRTEAAILSAQAAQAQAEAEAAAATAPPAPMTLAQALGVSAEDWNLKLVRSDSPLPPAYVPELAEIERGEYFDARAAAALKIMLAEARADGYTVYLCSGYRSYETQRTIFERHVTQYMSEGMTREQAEAATLIAVNKAGGSEHQLGLAADILESENQDMEPYIGGSGLMLWFEEHCAEYGFIVRYPEGKTDITGVEYEPWHLRYVGSCASYIMENHLCLEEFLQLIGG